MWFLSAQLIGISWTSRYSEKNVKIRISIISKSPVSSFHAPCPIGACTTNGKFPCHLIPKLISFISSFIDRNLEIDLPCYSFLHTTYHQMTVNKTCLLPVSSHQSRDSLQSLLSPQHLKRHLVFIRCPVNTNEWNWRVGWTNRAIFRNNNSYL